MNEPVLTEKKSRVLQARGDPRWDYRTIPAISRDTELSQDEVADVLAALDDQVRQSEVPDRLGRPLFTLKSRPTTAMEHLAKLRNFLAKSSA